MKVKRCWKRVRKYSFSLHKCYRSVDETRSSLLTTKILEYDAVSILRELQGFHGPRNTTLLLV